METREILQGISDERIIEFDISVFGTYYSPICGTYCKIMETWFASRGATYGDVGHIVHNVFLFISIESQYDC